jgi:hypothetical protein
MKKNENPKNDWTPEPFPEPRTIPEGWNSSAITDMESGSKNENPNAEWKPDPFPKPRSFPWRSNEE